MYVALDTETELIRQGLQAPPLVCLSWAGGDGSGLVGRNEVLAITFKLLKSDHHIIGHNLAYDMAVLAYEYPHLLPDIFEAYDAGRMHDTGIREKLMSLYDGNLRQTKFSLAACAERHLGLHLEKEDTYRMRYGELRLTPVEDWPEEARTYAVSDAETTFNLFNAQSTFVGQSYPDDIFADEQAQVRAAFAFRLMSARGMKADKELTKKTRKHYERQLRKLQRALIKAGFMDVKGHRKMKPIRARVEQLVENPLLTETGQISTNAHELGKIKDPDLSAVVEYIHVQKMLSTYVSALEQGNFEFPITPNVNTLLETGRTSMSRPNLQNLPRKEPLRECFIPREGFYFCMVDYDTAELRSLAQTCLTLFGESALAEALNAGADPHTSFAADMLGISWEDGQRLKDAEDETFLETRQLAKAANFGFPGGMGVNRFIETQARAGLTFTENEAADLKAAWLEQWPEMHRYFRHIKQDILRSEYQPQNQDRVKGMVTGRYRGGVGYCDAANNYFQALTADGAKAGSYALTREMYTDRSSVLYGARLVNFVHDENIVEVQKDVAHEAAQRIVEVMCDEMNRFTPNVPAGAQAVLCERWYKGAKPVFKEGRLIPWQPETVS